MDFRTIEMPLSFFRRGVLDVDSGQFINAFYNFFFFLECIFGSGQFKKHKLQAEFCKSTELCNAVTWAASEYVSIEKDMSSGIFKLINGGRGAFEILGFLIDRRGFLHHHTTQRKDIWHPERQNEWRPEAKFSQLACHKIAFDRMAGRFFSPEIEKRYFEMSVTSGACFRTVVEFTYMTPEGETNSGSLPMKVPGTKATHRMAEYLTKKFFKWFDEKLGAG